MLTPLDIVSFVVAFNLERLDDRDTNKFMRPWRQTFFHMGWSASLDEHGHHATIIGKDLARLAKACSAYQYFDASSIHLLIFFRITWSRPPSQPLHGIEACLDTTYSVGTHIAEPTPDVQTLILYTSTLSDSSLGSRFNWDETVDLDSKWSSKLLKREGPRILSARRDPDVPPGLLFQENWERNDVESLSEKNQYLKALGNGPGELFSLWFKTWYTSFPFRKSARVRMSITKPWITIDRHFIAETDDFFIRIGLPLSGAGNEDDRMDVLIPSFVPLKNSTQLRYI
jgi:hypothetical protein